MATITNYIKLVDGTSSVLEKIANVGNATVSKLERVSSTSRLASQSAEVAAQKFNMLRDVLAGNLLANGLIYGVEMAKNSLMGLFSMGDQYAGIQARLRIIGGSLQNAAYLNNQIYESAQRARGGYLDMAHAVGTMAMSAKDAFPDPREAVDFMEGINKLYAIGGTSKQNRQFATLQLTQGMASGALMGDEFRSIAENAPIIENMIAKTMGVSRGELKKLSSEGQITAEIIKKSILENMDEINAQFEMAPKQWGDHMTDLENYATKAFAPIFGYMSELANSDDVKLFIANAKGFIDDLVPIVQGVAVGIKNIMLGVGNAVFGTFNFLRQHTLLLNLAIIGVSAALAIMAVNAAAANAPVIAGAVAMTAKAVADWAETAALLALIVAQDGFNAALYACPITWIIALIIALIAIFYGVIAVINSAAGTSISATGIIFAAFAWLGAMIYNVVVTVWNIFVELAAFLRHVMDDPLAATYNLFAEIWNGIVGLVADAINTIIDLYNKIPGVKKVDLIQSASWSMDKMPIVDPDGIDMDGFKLNKLDVVNEANYAYNAGANLTDFSNPLANGGQYDGQEQQYDASLNPNIDPNAKDNAKANKETAKNTGKIAQAIQMSQDEIDELRDIATNSVVQSWQSKNITIQVTNNNDIASNVDVDGFNNDFLRGLREAFTENGEVVTV